MRFGQKMLEIQGTSIHSVNLVIIGHIIAIVYLGRSEKRGEPYTLNAQRLWVIQTVGHAHKIAIPIAITVLKLGHIDLIEYGFFPPFISTVRAF